jgi:hypothetical protein
VNADQFLRAVSESCLPLNDEERALLAAHIAQEVHWHMRVRRLKEERIDTLPPQDDRAVPVAEARAMMARGELPLAVSFEGEPDSRTRCEEPREMAETLSGEEG